MVANTDMKHYLNLTSTIYRLLPVLVTNEEVAMIHGPDEGITVASLTKAAGIYHSIMVWGARWT